MSYKLCMGILKKCSWRIQSLREGLSHLGRGMESKWKKRIRILI